MSVIKLAWPEGPRQIRLGPRDLQVWAVRLDGYSEYELAFVKQTLPEIEQTRAGRFHRRQHHDYYVIQHTVLRRLLGQYLDCDPASIQIGHGPNGKPELLDPKVPLVHFNQSRSNGLGLLAFTRLGPVGVDVEKNRSVPEFEDIVRAHFSEDEKRAMARLAPSDRLTAFFVAWTVKEAFLKATGEGITEGLAKVEVELGDLNQRRLRQLPSTAAWPGPWSCQALSPATGWIGSVVVGGTIERLQAWQAPPHPALWP